MNFSIYAESLEEQSTSIEYLAHYKSLIYCTIKLDGIINVNNNDKVYLAGLAQLGSLKKEYTLWHNLKYA